MFTDVPTDRQTDRQTWQQTTHKLCCWRWPWGPAGHKSHDVDLPRIGWWLNPRWTLTRGRWGHDMSVLLYIQFVYGSMVLQYPWNTPGDIGKAVYVSQTTHCLSTVENSATYTSPNTKKWLSITRKSKESSLFLQARQGRTTAASTCNHLFTFEALRE